MVVWALVVIVEARRKESRRLRRRRFIGGLMGLVN
jgi:hypothetical protein